MVESELLSEDSSKSERLATIPLVGGIPLTERLSLDAAGDRGEDRRGGLHISRDAGDAGDGGGVRPPSE